MRRICLVVLAVFIIAFTACTNREPIEDQHSDDMKEYGKLISIIAQRDAGMNGFFEGNKLEEQSATYTFAEYKMADEILVQYELEDDIVEEIANEVDMKMFAQSVEAYNKIPHYVEDVVFTYTFIFENGTIQFSGKEFDGLLAEIVDAIESYISKAKESGKKLPSLKRTLTEDEMKTFFSGNYTETCVQIYKYDYRNNVLSYRIINGSGDDVSLDSTIYIKSGNKILIEEKVTIAVKFKDYIEKSIVLKDKLNTGTYTIVIEDASTKLATDFVIE